MAIEFPLALSQGTPGFCTSCGVLLYPEQPCDAEGRCEHCAVRMNQYVTVLRHLLFGEVTEPAEMHALSLGLLALAPDAGSRHEAHRLSQEAFDKSSSAFRDRLYALWSSLPDIHKPELLPATATAGSARRPSEAEPDTIGLTKHRPRR